ncbi:unnamed protein product [Trichobilharzia regenti]|nr:unnamed protein product [Trichobilharzia regenti]
MSCQLNMKSCSSLALEQYFSFLCLILFKNLTLFLIKCFHPWRIHGVYNLKFNFMSFLLILLTITQYEFEFSKLFNPVDASLTSREYFKRSERFYGQLSRNNHQLTKALDNDNSNKWSEQSEGELFKSDMLGESKENDAADIKSNNNRHNYNYDINQITQNKEYYRLMIEKYKKKILRLLNLKSVPNVNVNNQSEWNSLPGVLRKRLKAEIDASNQLTNQLKSNEDEEKETLILLTQ